MQQESNFKSNNNNPNSGMVIKLKKGNTNENINNEEIF